MSKFDKYLTRKNAPIPQEHFYILKNGRELPVSSALNTAFLLTRSK